MKTYDALFSASDNPPAGHTITLAREVAVQNVNRAPTVTNAQLGPTAEVVFATEPLTLDGWTYQDPDSDAQDGSRAQIRWFRTDRRADPVPLPAFDDAVILTIDGNSVKVGDRVYCEVRGSDGLDLSASPARSSDVTVLNAPTAVSVLPNPARTADDLSFSLTWFDPAAAGNPAYDIQWRKGGGIPAGDTTGAVLDKTLTTRGDVWSTTVTAFANLSLGGRHDAPPVAGTLTIGDTPPPTPTAADYDLALPQADQALSVVDVDFAADDDNDPNGPRMSRLPRARIPTPRSISASRRPATPGTPASAVWRPMALTPARPIPAGSTWAVFVSASRSTNWPCSPAGTWYPCRSSR